VLLLLLLQLLVLLLSSPDAASVLLILLLLALLLPLLLVLLLATGLPARPAAGRPVGGGSSALGSGPTLYVPDGQVEQTLGLASVDPNPAATTCVHA
jgi:hypothetical protein